MYGKWRIETISFCRCREKWHRQSGEKRQKTLAAAFRANRQSEQWIGKKRSGSRNKQQATETKTTETNVDLLFSTSVLFFNMRNVLSFRYLLNKLLPRNLLAIWKRAKWQCNSLVLWTTRFLPCCCFCSSFICSFALFCGTFRCFNSFLSISLFCHWGFFSDTFFTQWPFFI